MLLPGPDRHLRPWLASWLALAVACIALPAVDIAAAATPSASSRELRRERDRQRLMVDISRSLAADRLDEAERQVRSLLAANRRDPDAYTLQAVLSARQGRTVQEGEAYRQALALAPARGDLLNNYGAWLCAQGHAAEALVLFERARRDPAHPQADVTANAGICAARAGQWELAERELRQALHWLPAHAGALAAMARVQLQMEQPLAARAFYQRRLAAAAADASVLQLAIEIEQRLGDDAAVANHKQRLAQLQGEGQPTPGKVEER